MESQSVSPVLQWAHWDFVPACRWSRPSSGEALGARRSLPTGPKPNSELKKKSYSPQEWLKMQFYLCLEYLLELPDAVVLPIITPVLPLRLSHCLGLLRIVLDPLLFLLGVLLLELLKLCLKLATLLKRKYTRQLEKLNFEEEKTSWLTWSGVRAISGLLRLWVTSFSTSWSSASPPVAADTPKYPFFGKTTFSALMHISKSFSLLDMPLWKRTVRVFLKYSILALTFKKNLG